MWNKDKPVIKALPSILVPRIYSSFYGNQRIKLVTSEQRVHTFEWFNESLDLFGAQIICVSNNQLKLTEKSATKFVSSESIMM